MTAKQTYDAFLSYNSLDHAIVERVANELGTRQCRCFVDRWYLQPGRDWVEALERALSSSRSVAMFIGPHEMGRWQQRERAWALDRLAGATDFPVIPVLLPGCEPPLGFMKQLMWIDLRNDPADPAQLDALSAAIRGETVKREGRQEPRANICPYRGLLAFREEDSEFFFGRQKYTDDLLQLVQHHSMVAVTGASGSGKSSVVRAGLVPRLRHRGDGDVWDILTMFPRENPLHSLADLFLPLVEPALSGIDLIRKRKVLAEDLEHARVPLWDLAMEGLKQQPGTDRLLLVVDQWEELYTNCKSDNQRNRFIKELLEATSRENSPLSVVLTVRWDFYGEILSNRPLLDRLQHSRLDLGPMNRDELRSAIEGPGGKVGLTFQDGLVDHILNDAGDEPGSLPLLEFVLEELWKCRRGDGELAYEAYKNLGRLTGAIATRAEAVFMQLSREEQTAAESLFHRLVQAGAKTEEDTRRRAELNSLDATSQQVARKLADERLLVTTRTEATSASGAEANGNQIAATETVEVAHEELLRRWERLKKWVDTDRQFLQWRSRLIPRLDEYKRDSKSALLTGNALRESRIYVPSRNAELDPPERTFVVASQDAARRWKMWILCVSSLAAVVAIAITLGVYYSQQIVTAMGNMNLYVAKTADQTADTFDLLIDPYESYLVEPLHEVFERQISTDFNKLNAAYALARFDAIKPHELRFLLEAIPTAKPEHREKNFEFALSAISDRKLLQDLLDELASQPVKIDEESGEFIQSYRYGLTGEVQGIPSPLTICTQFDADPTDRSDLIHQWNEWPLGIDAVLGILKAPGTDNDLRSALFCVIGLHSEDPAWATKREELILLLNDGDKTSEEPGLHFTAEWALRKWNAAPESIIETRTGQWETNSQKMTMILIPAGKFKMGTDGGDDQSDSPRHEVEVQKGFYLSNREVSVEQFMRFVNDTDYTGPQLVDWNGYDKDVSPDVQFPVQQVSWLDAVRYCNWLSRKEEGLKIAYDEQDWKPIPGANGYRLPTEEQWEYACRAGSDTEYSSGNNSVALADYAVFSEQTTQPCGSRIPNAWGLFDMHGNVWEWCEDSYRESYKKDAVINETSRVLRGGSFSSSDPQFLRSAYRFHRAPGSRRSSYGFRISRTPYPSEL